MLKQKKKYELLLEGDLDKEPVNLDTPPPPGNNWMDNNYTICVQARQNIP